LENLGDAFTMNQLKAPGSYQLLTGKKC